MPVPEKQIRFDEAIGTTGVRAFLTPGHAQHHCCYLLDDLLFGGEVAGVRCDVPTGIFMRPATPPRFILQVALDSIDRMITLAPNAMVFAHYGMVTNPLDHLRIARQQLLLWVGGVAATLPVEEERREAALVEWLLARDPQYRNQSLLPADIQARERYFLGNTLRGMTEYVTALSAEERQALIQAAEGMD